MCVYVRLFGIFNVAAAEDGLRLVKTGVLCIYHRMTFHTKYREVLWVSKVLKDLYALYTGQIFISLRLDRKRAISLEEV